MALAQPIASLFGLTVSLKVAITDVYFAQLLTPSTITPPNRTKAKSNVMKALLFHTSQSQIPFYMPTFICSLETFFFFFYSIVGLSFCPKRKSTHRTGILVARARKTNWKKVKTMPIDIVD